MALLSFNSDMVYWKIKVESFDVTELHKKYIRSIRVVDKAYVNEQDRGKRKESKENGDHASTAEISFTANNYYLAYDTHFVMGRTIQIWMGYDPLTMPLVFSGRIKHVPEGSAKDLIEFTVTAISDEVCMADKQRNETHYGPKAMIIRKIALRNGWLNPVVKIGKGFAGVEPRTIVKEPLYQVGMSDLEFLMRKAEEWNCVMWFSRGGSFSGIKPVGLTSAMKGDFYFIQDSGFAKYRQQLPGGSIDPTRYDIKTGRSLLGFRSGNCCLESISWKFHPTAPEENIVTIDETGKYVRDDLPSVIDYYSGTVWRLKKDVYEDWMKNPGEAAKVSALMATKGITEGKDWQLKTYFEQVSSADDRKNYSPPKLDNSGIQITLTMNKGDVYLKPPRLATISTPNGTLDPNINGIIPQWIIERAGGKVNPRGDATFDLFLKEISLEFSDGMLKQRIDASFGLGGISRL